MIKFPIKCPRCENMIDELIFWKKINDEYFNICRNCINDKMSEDELLMIGFHHGKIIVRKDFKEFLDKQDKQ